MTTEPTEYPVAFYARTDDLFGWWVYSIYEDGIHRREAGPFWRKITAWRVEGALTKNYRTGFDMGRKYQPPLNAQPTPRMVEKIGGGRYE